MLEFGKFKYITERTIMSIGKNLKKFRKDAHLTQVELAKKINANQNDIYRWEYDKVIPSIETLKKLSVALNISIDNILFTAKERKKFKLADKELLKKMKDIDKLPTADKEAIIRMIDAFKSKLK